MSTQIYEISKFCERLKELIVEKEITPDALAAGIGYAQVYSWLSGLYLPSYVYLNKLADYFHCSIDFLVGLNDDDRSVMSRPCPPFSEKFPIVLKECNSNIYRLSKETKIDRRTMYDWKKGQYLPTLENLVKLATALGCTIDYLIGREK